MSGELIIYRRSCCCCHRQLVIDIFKHESIPCAKRHPVQPAFVRAGEHFLRAPRADRAVERRGVRGRHSKNPTIFFRRVRCFALGNSSPYKLITVNAHAIHVRYACTHNMRLHVYVDNACMHVCYARTGIYPCRHALLSIHIPVRMHDISLYA